jgi:hypothetical protein
MINKSGFLPGGGRSSTLFLCVFFILINIPFLIHDFTFSDRFFSGDRLHQRHDKIEYAFHAVETPYAQIIVATEEREAATTLFERVVALSGPGDYLLHGFLLETGGRPLVLFVQLGLALIAALCVLQLGLLLGLTERFALVGALLYSALPGTIGNAHQLVTEGVFNPLVVIAIYLLTRCLSGQFEYRWLLIASLAIACASFLRVQLLLFPLVVAMLMLYDQRGKAAKATALFLVLSMGIPLGIIAFEGFLKGTFAVGASDFSLAHNFYLRSERIAAVAGLAFDGTVFPGKQMPLSAFLEYIFAHPIAYIQTVFTDVVNIIVNPGTKWFATDYLHVVDFSENYRYFVDVRDQQGLWGVALAILGQGPLFAMSFFGGMIVWCLILLGAGIGAIVFLSRTNVSLVVKALLVLFVLYEIGVSVVAGGLPRWTYRTPFEFLIVAMLAFSLEWFWSRMEVRRSALASEGHP